jgi:hypothetical protein
MWVVIISGLMSAISRSGDLFSSNLYLPTEEWDVGKGREERRKEGSSAARSLDSALTRLSSEAASRACEHGFVIRVGGDYYER